MRLRGVEWAALGLLLIYLAIGLSIADDYGISWDEQINREFGHRTLDHASVALGLGGEEAGAKEQASVVEYGPVFELVLAALERLVGSDDSRDVFLLRHRATFVAWWAGIVAYYLLLRRVLDDAGLALLGALTLVLTPRLFADSFYNSKDAVLVSLFVISTWTLSRLLERKSVSRVLVHALACAAAIDLRLVALLLPALTLFFLALEALERRLERTTVRAAAWSAALYLAALAVFVTLLWPQLWDAPATRLGEALSRLGDARQLDNAFALYRGSFVSVKELPWHYLPTWIAITTPPMVLALFLVGLAVCVRGWFSPGPLPPENRWSLLFVLLLFAPLVAVALFRPTLYDGWRHFYFVYPAILAIALCGVREACAHAALRPWALGLVSVGLAWSLVVIVRDHPHQQTYFNAFAPRDVEGQFELDYWGLSFRDGLTEVLRREPVGSVTVAVSDLPGFLNALILPKDQRDRIQFVPAREAEYFLSNHRQPEHHRRFQERLPPYVNEVHTVRAGDRILLGVYRLRE